MRTLEREAPVIPLGDNVASFAWDGRNAQGAVVPRGPYLFCFEVHNAEMGPGRDYDCDKSALLTVDQLTWSTVGWAPSTGTHTISASYRLTDGGTPRQDASAATLRAFDPDLVEVGQPAPAPGPRVTNAPGAPNPAWNEAQFQVTVQKADRHWYLASAQDNRATRDKAHRARWALQLGVNPVHALAVNDDFANFPNPPPVGTTPYATVVRNCQRGPLADGSFYAAQAYTNRTAQAAFAHCKQAAIYYVFGHGAGPAQGEFRQFMGYWNGAYYTYLVQTAAVRERLVAGGVPIERIVVIDEEPAGALSRLLLAVFEGCSTG